MFQLIIAPQRDSYLCNDNKRRRPYLQFTGRQTRCCWSHRLEKEDSSVNTTSLQSSGSHCSTMRANSSRRRLCLSVKRGFCAAAQLFSPASFNLRRIVQQEISKLSVSRISLALMKGSVAAMAIISLSDSSSVALGLPLRSESSRRPPSSLYA